MSLTSVNNLDFVELAARGLQAHLQEAVIKKVVDDAVREFEQRLMEAITRASVGISLKHIETVKDVARLRDELRVHLGIHVNEEFIAEITKEIQ